MGEVKILKASAGSGKTYRLAYEYIKGVVCSPLLYRGTLAVTFTNKATEQMKRRIIESLHALASAPETAPLEGDSVLYLDDLIQETGLSRGLIIRNAAQARSLILHDYSRFAVSTIDKFFQRVARAFFRELGLGFDYTVEIDSDWILSMAVDRVLERTASDSTIREAVGRMVDQRSEQGAGWDVRPDIVGIGGELFKESYRLNPNGAEQILKVYNDIVRDIAEQFSGLKNVAQKAVEVILAAGLEPSDFKQGKSSFAAYVFRLSQSETLLSYNSYFSKSSESVDSWCTKTSPCKAEIQALETELMPLVQDLRRRIDAMMWDYNSQKLVDKNLGRSLLLNQIGEQVKAVSSEQNIVMINETSTLIHRLVMGNDAPFIYEKVGNAYSRYMIDEFQDTSQKQWDNFKPLLDNALSENDGDPVMLIGDVKQSIYRWRGGNWRILGYEADEYFAGAIAPTVPMDTNWRSERNIVDFNNSLIRQVVEWDSELLKEFLESAPKQVQGLSEILKHSYEGFEQKCSPKKMDHVAEGYVEVIPTFSDQIAPLMAGRVADIISRGYALRDIAVLVRSNREARQTADILLEAGYAIVSQEALLLSGSPAVGFVMALFTMAAHPEDSVERALYNTFLGRRYGAKIESHEEAFIGDLLRVGLIEGFERIMVRYGLGERKEAVPFLQALYQVIISYNKQAISDVQLLLEWWRENGGKKTVYLPSEQDAVTIMTIHKAKGLEFKCVIIPFCEWGLLPKSGKTTLWVEADGEQAGLFADLGPMPIGYKEEMGDSHFREEYYRESVYAHVDNLNMLYVALTRAERELYVMYDGERAKVKSSKSKVSTVSKLIDGVLPRIEGLTEIPYNLSDGSSGSVFAYGVKGEAPMRDGAAADGGERRIVLDSLPSHDAAQRVRVRWASDRYFGQGSDAVSPRRYGVMMHRLFEWLEVPAELDQVLDKMRIAGDISSDEERKMLHTKATEALSDPIVARWFSAEWELVHNERDIVTGDGVKRPDRVMTQGRERAVVVDYKFGAIQKSSYRTQVKEYMNLLKGMGYKDVEGYLWFVELGEVEQVTP